MTTTEVEQGSEWSYLVGSLRDALTVIFKYKVLIVTLFCAVFVPVTFWTWFMFVPQFEAYSSLLVKFGREHVYKSEVTEQSSSSQFDRSAAILSEIEIIESQDLAEAVVKRLGVDNMYPRKETEGPEQEEVSEENRLYGATQAFQDNLEVYPVTGADVLELSFVHPNPQIAANALNQLVDLYKEKHLRIYRDPTNTSFFETQLENYKQQFTEAERQFQGFKKKHGLTSPEQEKDLLLHQRSELEISLKRAQNNIQGLNGKLISLERQLEDIPENLPRSSVTEREAVIERAKADLFDLRRQEQAVSAKYTEISRPVLNIRKEIALVEKFIKEQEADAPTERYPTGKNPIYEQIEIGMLRTESELNAARARNKVIAGQIALADKELKQLDGIVRELGVFERKMLTAQERFQLYLKKTDESRLSEEMDRLKMTNISVIQPAVVPKIPTGAPSNLKVLLGAIIGGLAGIGMAFFLEYIGQQYSTPEQVTRDVGLPVLAWIPNK